MRSLSIACLIIPALAALPAGPAGAAHARSSIIVADAAYGPRAFGGDCPALQAVRRVCQARSRCSVSLSDDLCDFGATPKPSLFPWLTVTYRCAEAGRDRHGSAAYPFKLELSCASG